MDPNTSGNVRSRYIGLWMLYGGLVVLFTGMALWLAVKYQLIDRQEFFADENLFASYLLIVAGAFLIVAGYLFRQRGFSSRP